MNYSITRQEIVDAALSFRGVPFLHQGRDRNGVDCMGLFAVILKSINYPDIVDYEGYRKSPPASLVYNTLKANFEEVETAQPGDIFLLRPPGSMKPKHGAMLISDEHILHAWPSDGVVLAHLSSWRPRIVTTFALRGAV